MTFYFSHFEEDIKPVDGFIKEVMKRTSFDLKEQARNLETLQGAQKLLQENKENDIIFKVQEEEIPAHKDILSLRSSYFSNMFSSNTLWSFVAKWISRWNARISE